MLRLCTRGCLYLGALALALWSPPASACGGFFCSQLPVDQTAERIIFALTPTKTTAYIQINYQGDADKFSWVVPVQAVPNIKLGSQSTFAALEPLTAPQFNLDYEGLKPNDTCGPSFLVDEGASPPSSSKDVQVIDAKQVGPFDTVVLKSRSTAELVTWLSTNGYTQPPTSTPLIDHYVNKGMYFVAVKLNKSASVGEIAPLALEMDTQEACVPLILTQIAAVPNMPVIIYVLGSARAFPRNWFHVEMNHAQVNWLQGGSNYVKMATAAINEAAGHGFITEFAGAASIAKDRILQPGTLSTVGLAGVTSPTAVLQQLVQAGFPRDASMLAILREFIPLPASLAAQGIDDRTFYNNIAQYEPQLNGFQVDSAGLIKALQERVVTPLVEAQAMFDNATYLTRLMATVSPDEMNRDPLFLLNPDLPPVSNVHTAKVGGMCGNDGVVKNLTLTLEDGQVLSLGDTRLFDGTVTWKYEEQLPRAKRIQLVGATGQAVTIKRTEVKRIDQELNKELPEVVRSRAIADGAIEPAVPVASDDSGCNFSGRAGTPSLLALLALAALVARRARRT